MEQLKFSIAYIYIYIYIVQLHNIGMAWQNTIQTQFRMHASGPMDALKTPDIAEADR